MTSHWAVKPEAGFEAFQTLMRGVIGEGVYLGAALRKYRANAQTEDTSSSESTLDRKLIYRANVVTYGVPILRVV